MGATIAGRELGGVLVCIVSVRFGSLADIREASASGQKRTHDDGSAAVVKAFGPVTFAVAATLARV